MAQTSPIIPNSIIQSEANYSLAHYRVFLSPAPALQNKNPRKKYISRNRKPFPDRVWSTNGLESSQLKQLHCHLLQLLQKRRASDKAEGEPCSRAGNQSMFNRGLALPLPLPFQTKPIFTFPLEARCC